MKQLLRIAVVALCLSFPLRAAETPGRWEFGGSVGLPAILGVTGGYWWSNRLVTRVHGMYWLVFGGAQADVGYALIDQPDLGIHAGILTGLFAYNMRLADTGYGTSLTWYLGPAAGINWYGLQLQVGGAFYRSSRTDRDSLSQRILPYVQLGFSPRFSRSEQN